MLRFKCRRCYYQKFTGIGARYPSPKTCCDSSTLSIVSCSGCSASVAWLPKCYRRVLGRWEYFFICEYDSCHFVTNTCIEVNDSQSLTLIHSFVTIYYNIPNHQRYIIELFISLKLTNFFGGRGRQQLEGLVFTTNRSYYP